MIMGQNGRYLPETTHDHKARPPQSKIAGRNGLWETKTARDHETRPPKRAARRLVVVVAAVATAVLQPVEQPAARPRRGLSHAPEDPDQRVLGPRPRLLVGPGRATDFLADRGIGVGL